MTEQTQDTQARLFQVVEVTERGILPAGHYMAVRTGVVIMDVEVDEPTHPRDLIERVLSMHAEGGTDA